MSKKLIVFVALMAVLLLSVSFVAAQSNLPGSGWRSGQQIQNVGNSNATIVFDAYDPTGQVFSCGSQQAAPGGSVNVQTDSNCPVPAGFIGSAVVSADQPIAAIVNVLNTPVGQAGGMYRGTDGADVNTKLAFPLIKNNFNSRTTSLYLQNASGTPNNISVVFSVEGTDYTYTKNGVPANAMIVVSGADATPPVPTGKFGSASATGSQPLAGTALEYESAVAVGNNLQAYTAFTPAGFDSVANCPLIRNAQSGAVSSTGIQAQNVSGATQKISAKYTYTTGGGPVQTKTVTSADIPDGGSANFFTPSNLPANSLGSAQITGMGGGDIAVIVNDSGNGVTPSLQTAYTCFAQGTSTEIAMPLYKEFFKGNTAGIQVQNAGGSTATVEASYSSTPFQGKPSKTVVYSASIPAGSSITFYGVSNLSSPPGLSVVSGTPSDLNGTFGSVVIESTNGQPIVGIVNEAPGGPGPASEDAKLYEGFNQ